jgi:capsule polysaccharide export protein KpsC/LpsZ
MKIIVSKPINAINKYRGTPDNYVDIESLYDKLPSILAQMELDFEVIDAFDKTPPCDIHFAWHRHGNASNTWYVKSGYLKDYFYFDRTGYSGWSTLVNEYHCNIDSETANKFVDEFQLTSRMHQPSHTSDVTSPYVLVLGQKWGDKVLDFSYFDSELFDMVSALYESSDYNVVLKPHPLNVGAVGIQGNLQDLVAGATAIYTVNSGSGFEALFQGKRVFTTGVSDYHWGTSELKTLEEFQNSKHLLNEPVDTDRINKFLYYCFTEYFMHTTDEQSIQKKIQQAIDQAS